MFHRRLILILVFSIFLFPDTQIYGQADSTTTGVEHHVIGFRAKATTSGIQLRWAPLNAPAWSVGNRQGYVLEKIAFIGPLDSLHHVALSKPVIKPWPLDDWKVFAEQADKTPLIAAEAIYGENDVNLKASGMFATALEGETRFSFALLAADMSIACAEASGLYYEDTDVIPGEMYGYRIYLAGERDSALMDTAYVLIQAADMQIVPAVEEFTYRSANGEVQLSWLNPPFQTYSGFRVERKEGTGDWQPLHDHLFIQMKSRIDADDPYVYFRDTTTVPRQTYRYRVRGLDAFGEFSEPAELEAEARALMTPLQPSNPSIHRLSDTSIEVHWSYPKSEEMNLLGFNVLESRRPDDFIDSPINKQMLSNTTRSLVIDGTLGREFYRIQAISKDSVVTSSITVANLRSTSEQLAPPIELLGFIDSSGIATLTWEHPAKNRVLGYDVYVSNSPNGVFTKATTKPLPVLAFFDSLTLHTLSEDIYYYVVALDYSYAESEPSEVITLSKPDIIPPAPAVFRSYQVTDSGIQLIWHLSSSRDVVRQELQRALDQSDRWEVRTPLAADVTTFLDQTTVEGKTYRYRLVVVDDAGHQTLSPTDLRLSFAGSFYLPTPESIAIRAQGDSTKISWSYPLKNDITFAVFRSRSQGPFTTYRRVTASELVLSAEDVRNCRFKVRAVRSDGKQSQFSAWVTAPE